VTHQTLYVNVPAAVLLAWPLVLDGKTNHASP
jgi:hypothetical protein